LLPCVTIPSYLSIFAHMCLSTAKEDRRLYTLKPITTTTATPPPVFSAPVPPATNPPPVSRAAGPVRSDRKTTTARMRTGPMTPALKARILANLAKNPSKAKEVVGNGTQVTVPPTEAQPVERTKPTQPIWPVPIIDPSGDQEVPLDPLPLGEAFEDILSYSSTFSDFEDNESFTSTISDVFDVGMDDSEPLATGPWTIIDHFTGEIVVDNEVAPTASNPPFDSSIQVEVIPALGINVLIQTKPPTLLFEDQDERPNWLIRSTNEFIQHTPYYMCLNKVVDLFFAQEARLGYPSKVSHLGVFSWIPSLTTYSPFTSVNPPPSTISKSA
jgi:hypothetical protein